MPAASRNARHRADGRRRRVGAAGTPTMQVATGSSNARRRPNRRQSRSDYRPHCRNFPGTSRKTSLVRKALIFLELWGH